MTCKVSSVPILFRYMCNNCDTLSPVIRAVGEGGEEWFAEIQENLPKQHCQ